MDRVGRTNVVKVRILHEIEVFEVGTGEEDARACEQTYASRKNWHPYGDIKLIAYVGIHIRGCYSDGCEPGAIPCVCIFLGQPKRGVYDRLLHLRTGSSGNTLTVSAIYRRSALITGISIIGT